MQNNLEGPKGGESLPPSYPGSGATLVEWKKHKWGLAQGLCPPQGKVVLEGGAGRGEFAIAQVRGGADFVVAVDILPEMLAEAAANAYSAGAQGKLDLVRANLETLPFSDASFDLVTFFGTFMHLPHPEVVLAEVARVLVRGGRLVFDYFPLNPFLKLVDPSLEAEGFSSPLLRVGNFLGQLTNEVMTAGFGFAWSRTRFTHRLYRRFFSQPIKYYSQRAVVGLMRQNGMRTIKVQRLGHPLWPREYLVLGEKP